MVCAACGARNKMSAVKLSNEGKLYNYTVVHRNFPGVPVPFISAIVDLEGGGTLKGNLVDMVRSRRICGSISANADPRSPMPSR